MPVQINWSVNVQVADGPQLGIAQTDSVSGYDVADVPIPPSSDDKAVDVDIQPGPASQVRFLLITSSVYGAGLTYKVGDAAEAVQLDGPLLLVGSGAISLLRGDPKTLHFSNKLEGDPTAVLRILVGRMVTPAPAEGGGGESGGDGDGGDEGGGGEGGDGEGDSGGGAPSDGGGGA